MTVINSIITTLNTLVMLMFLASTWDLDYGNKKDRASINLFGFMIILFLVNSFMIWY